MGIFQTFKRTRKITVIVIVALFFILIFSQRWIYPKDELEYGLTFSKKQAQSLGLDWQTVFTAMLSDLGVRKLRLAAYWDEIEPENGVYKWDDVDWQLNEAAKYDAEVILAVGGRLPRWPECHFPAWADDLDNEARQQATLVYIKETVQRYRDNNVIKAWQIENEPFLPNFGECPELDAKFLDKEIALVRSLDSRLVIITDSGELSLWVPAAKRADIFGTSLYRDTYSNALKSYVHYPIEPGFFRLKRNLASLFADPIDWVVIEMQAEPWAPVPFQELSKEERDKTMSFEKFNDMIEFSSQTGFKSFYLWGVEWWYWEKVINGDNRYWERARFLYVK